MLKLDELIKRNWLIQGGVITPNLDWYPASSITSGLKKKFPEVSLNYIITYFQDQGRNSNWVLDEDCMKERSEYLEENPEFLHKMHEQWKEEIDKYYKLLERFENEGINNLLEDYIEFYNSYREEFTTALVTEYFTILSDVIVEKIAKKVPREQREFIDSLLFPPEKSFMNEEEESTMEIGLELFKISKEKNKKIQDLELEEVKSYEGTYSKLKEHQKKFFWIRNNYKHTEPITIKQFLEDVKEAVMLLNEEEVKNKLEKLRNYEERISKLKKESLEKLDLPKKDLDLLLLIGTVALWHDQRKKANLIGNHWANKFLEIISKKYKIDLLTLQFTIPPELFEFLKGKELNWEEIKKRTKGCMLYNDLDDGYCFYAGEEFEKLKKEILLKGMDDKISDFRGTTASYGKVQGIVRVVTNPREEFKDKEILVTFMTRPDFVPLMKRAKAIVTSEGGIMSHAAIVARELGIPCIVGTRIATKVLKSGDLVEVNGNHGLVKIIKRAED